MIYDGYREEQITFMRVGLPRSGIEVPWTELGVYEKTFTAGTIELSSDSDLGASGSLDFSGNELPETRDLVRVIYTMTDEKGNAQTTALGTFLLAVSEPTYNMDTTTGSCDLLSVLHIAASKKFGKVTVIPRGGYCVDRAKALIESLGLRVSASDSARMLNYDMIFDADQSYLDAANALLDAAGFNRCKPDAYGNVLMQPKPVGALAPAWVFSDDLKSVMLPEVVLTETATDAPNAVYLSWDSGTYGAWAAAKNEDADSSFSIQNKGYEVSFTEEVSDLEAQTQTQAIAELKARAQKRLVDESGNTEEVTLKHPWLPITTGDAISLDYTSAGIEWSGQVASMSMSFDASSHVEVETKATRQCPADFQIKLSGGVL